MSEAKQESEKMNAQETTIYANETFYRVTALNSSGMDETFSFIGEEFSFEDLEKSNNVTVAAIAKHYPEGKAKRAKTSK